MKKTTIMLIAIVLVCSSAFATLSMTVGAGFGMHTKFGKDKVFGNGATGLVGLDLSLANGITFYDDAELMYVLKTQNGRVGSEEEPEPITVLFARTGVGYTFKVKNLAFVVGVGPEVKVTSEMVLNKTTNIEELKNVFNFGVDTRLKTTLYFSENTGVSFQVSPSVEFTKKAFFSMDAMVGLTFTH